MTACACGRPLPTNTNQEYAHKVAHDFDGIIAEMDAGLAEIEREWQLTWAVITRKEATNADVRQ